jgi:hypothetical protein
MSKETIKYKGYTAERIGLSGWYQWTIYGPADAGIVGAVKEYDEYFDVEFFQNGNIISFSAGTIQTGISKWVNR